ncbi:hypothetical protein E4U41_002104 [Claviceps citrina]|nr:hypothetical protein E4U41_002104 [Claviceps citrina]
MHLQPIEKSPDGGPLARAGRRAIAAEEGHASPDQLDDVFGPAPVSSSMGATQPSDAHPSDMPRLQTEHATAGYREGITAAKASSIQAGFDEGFSLGASIGSRAGRLLGLLEGIADALGGAQHHTAEAAEAAEASSKLLRDARAELAAERIFSAEFWAPDGNWRYEVPVARDDDSGQQVLFADVAEAHPLVRKWSGLVRQQLEAWQIQMSLLDDETGPRLDEAAVLSAASTAPVRAKQTLDW